MNLFNFLKNDSNPFRIKDLLKVAGTLLLLMAPIFTFAADGGAAAGNMPAIGGIRIEFFLFAAILVCVAIFHDQTFYVALIGLAVVLGYKLIFDPAFNLVEHCVGTTPFADQVQTIKYSGEWSTILNLAGLLLGFGILAKIFEESGIPDVLPRILPNNFMGPFLLLVMVYTISTFLDNIAAALIGGTIALVVFNKKVHIGYIAAIVGASNAGGAGTVLGDTTTTMMWIDGVYFTEVFHAFIASVTALVFFGWFAAHQQHKFQPIIKDSKPDAKIKWSNLLVVLLILAGAIATNMMFDMPMLGVWAALIVGMLLTKIPWGEIPGSIKGTIFLLCLVFCASLIAG